MEATGNCAMSCRGNDWQDGWGMWKNSAWPDHSYEGGYAYNQNAYPSWQLSNEGHYLQTHDTDYSQTATGVLSASMLLSSSRASEKKSVKPLPFDFLRALQGDGDDSDDDDAKPGISDRQPSDQESTAASGGGTTEHLNSSDDEGDRFSVRKEANQSKVGKSSTQAEKDEAECIVRKAFSDAKERDTLRAKVSTASSTDLQAMLNARLKK
jgi:hypothetical protein